MILRLRSGVSDLVFASTFCRLRGLVTHCGAAVACVMGALTGCGTSDTVHSPVQDVSPGPTGVASPVKILVVEAPAVADSIRQQWHARSDEQLEVDNIDIKDFTDHVFGSREVDVIVYPPRFLGGLVESQRIVPLPKFVLSDADWDRTDIFELIRLREITWGGQVQAVPLGSPQFILYYRPDVMAALNLRVPETWEQMGQLAELLADRDRLGTLAPPEPSPWYAVVQPLGPAWAGQMLLARAASYATHRGYYSTLFDYRTMEPLIHGAPFVRALNELVHCASHGPSTASTLSPWDAGKVFSEGKCALALSWPSHDMDLTWRTASGRPVPVGYAELPGSKEVFDVGGDRWELREGDEDVRVPLLGIAGRIGSVSRHSKQRRRAFQLLRWLSGRQWSGVIASGSRVTTLFRHSQRAEPTLWGDKNGRAEVANQYVDAVVQALSRKNSLTTVRIPGHDRYMAALDRAVHRAMAGETSSRVALEEAAAAWREITSQFGLDAQRQAYRRSLGVDPIGKSD